MNILVSACLLGVSCRYDGKCQPANVIDIEAVKKYGALIPVCPEVYGGMPTPRIPSERKGSRVIGKDGSDVTEFFCRGAEEMLKIAKINDCQCAILKERSPSCGHGKIYDGTFTGKQIRGNGIFAELLEKNGIKVCGETECIEFLEQEIKKNNERTD